jgi:type IV pilus assembly protein PilQ
MRNSTRRFGVLFLATVSVYVGQAYSADPAKQSGQAGYFSKSAATTQASASNATEDLLTELQSAQKANRDRVRQAGDILGVAAPAAGAGESKSAPGAKPDGSPASADPFATEVVESTGSSVTAEDVAYSADAGTVEIHVNEANLVEVLRMLSMQSQKNIIASKEVKGTVTANLYGVTVREALDALLRSNGYVYKEEGNFVYVFTAEEVKAQQQANRVRRTEVFRLHYIDGTTATTMLKPVLSEAGELAFSAPSEVGLASGGSTGGNGHSDQDIIVVTDFDDRLEEVKRVLKEVDQRPAQILIEATILRATLKEDNSLGIDFQVLGGVDFSTLGDAGSNFAGATGGGFLSSTNAAAQNTVNNGYAAGGTNFASQLPNGGLQIGVAKNNIAVFLKALESVTDTAVVANPKVLALNKQKGEVFVGNDIGYRTTVTGENGTTSEQVEFLKTGTRLVFRPFIGNDGFIRMEIKPEDSSGNLQNGLPFKFTTEVATNILVKDGHTVVIGGLFRENSNTTRGQVPGLGNLPGVGALFRNQVDATVREEIIVLLTPHVIKDDSILSQMGEEDLARVEKLRVGVRRGMMPWGRERLAESAYDTAVSEANRTGGDMKKALWHLNVALNLNPKFIEAIQLREKLTGETLTGTDNSLVRSYVRRAIERDLDKVAPVEPTKPVEGQPAEPSQPTASAVDATTDENAIMIEEVGAALTAPGAVRYRPESYAELQPEPASSEPAVTSVETGDQK